MEMRENDSKRVLFHDIDSWLRVARKALRELLNGSLGVLVAIVSAIVSIAYKIWTVFTRLVHARPLLSVALVSVFLIATWMMLYAGKCAEAKTYEHQRDSLAYELSKFTQAYTPKDSIIIVGDSTYIYCYQ